MTPRATALCPALTHPAVRDLHWVVTSPSLCQLIENAPTIVTEPSTWAALQKLDQNPEPLLEFLRLHRASGRLGNLFEAYLHFWLSEINPVPELHASVPIREGKQTLGELDFLFRDPQTQRPIHWEVAVKFYMCIAPIERIHPLLSDFVGQSLQDRLDLKLGRVLTHQLKLPQTAAADATLSAWGMSRPSSHLFLKGRLFYPVRTLSEANTAPTEVSPHHLRGWWSAFSENEFHLPKSDTGHWIILPKERWLASAVPTHEHTLETTQSVTEKLAAHFQHQSDAWQLAEMIQNKNGEWEERSRGMILPPHWPHRPELSHALSQLP